MSSVGFVAIRMRGLRPCFSEGSVFASFGLPPGSRSTCPEALASASAAFRSFDCVLLRLPGPVQGLRRHPAVEDVQVEPVVPLAHQQDAGVDGALELRVLHRAPGGLAVHVGEDGRGRGEDDPGRGVVELERPDRLVGVRHLEEGHEAVEGQGAGDRRHLLAHDLEEGAVLLGMGREGHLLELAVRQGHEPRLLVHHRLAVRPDDPVDGGRVLLLLQGDGRVQGQPAAVPGVDLRLVDGDDAGGGLDLARPAPVEGVGELRQGSRRLRGLGGGTAVPWAARTAAPRETRMAAPSGETAEESEGEAGHEASVSRRGGRGKRGYALRATGTSTGGSHDRPDDRRGRRRRSTARPSSPRWAASRRRRRPTTATWPWRWRCAAR